MSETMQAYHGRDALKAAMLAGIAEHERLDQIISGTYDQFNAAGAFSGGCAVGCTLETLRQIEGLPTIQHNSHALYERYLGVPEVLARLEDGIFEGLPPKDRTTWPRQFAEAIPVGADLLMVWPRFALDLLTAPDGAIQQRVHRYPAIGPSISAVAALYQRWVDGAKPARDEWVAVRRSAAAATAAAAATTASATAYVAYAAAYALDVDAYAATAAYAAGAAGAAAARQPERRRQANVLLRLLRESR